MGHCYEIIDFNQVYGICIYSVFRHCFRHRWVHFLVGKSEFQKPLEVSIKDLNEKLMMLKENEKNAVRAALTEERSRYCLLIQCIKPFMVSAKLLLLLLLMLLPLLLWLVTLTLICTLQILTTSTVIVCALKLQSILKTIFCTGLTFL